MPHNLLGKLFILFGVFKSSMPLNGLKERTSLSPWIHPWTLPKWDADGHFVTPIRDACQRVISDRVSPSTDNRHASDEFTKDWSFSLCPGPRGLTFMWWGCCGLCFRHKPTELADSFLFYFCIYFSLYGPFNCTSFHKFSRQLSAFSLCSSGLTSALSVFSTIYLFMKVSFSPDIILCGWLGLKHQLTS